MYKVAKDAKSNYQKSKSSHRKIDLAVGSKRRLAKNFRSENFCLIFYRHVARQITNLTACLS
jgi:hypothetical protein